MDALLNRFETREFRLILGGLVMLALVATVSYGVTPHYKAMSAARERLNALKHLPPAGDVTTQLSGMREMVDGLERALHGDAGNLPARELESYMIGKLQSIAWSHEVELVSVRPGQRERVSGFWETTFQVEVSGSYQALYSLMHEMRQKLGFVVVKKFQLTPISTRGEDTILRATMSIASYQSK